MTLNPDDPVVAQAVLGQKARDWLTSDLGKYVITRADSDIDRARQALVECPWWNSRRIRRLQNEAKVAQLFKVWMADAIIEGRNALQIIEDVDGSGD